MEVVKKKHINEINVLRAIATLMIIILHTTFISQLASPKSISIIIPYFGQAVPLFFCISGFVLTYSYYEIFSSQTSVKNFYISRYFRVAPLFYLMIIAWWILSYFQITNHITFQNIFLSIFFLFNLVPNQQESIVWAGWSMGIEMIFYLLFPVFLCLIRSASSAILALIVTLILAHYVYASYTQTGLQGYNYKNFFYHLPYFITGIFTFQLWKNINFRRSKNTKFNKVSLFLFVVLLIFSLPLKIQPYYSFSEQYMQLIWCFVFSGLILSAVYWQNFLTDNRFTNYLGNVCYSLYLTHPFVIMLLFYLNFYRIIENSCNNIFLSYLVAQVLTFLIVLAVSSITFKFIELPGIKLGQFIIKTHIDIRLINYYIRSKIKGRLYERLFKLF